MFLFSKEYTADKHEEAVYAPRVFKFNAALSDSQFKEGRVHQEDKKHLDFLHDFGSNLGKMWGNKGIFQGL